MKELVSVRGKLFIVGVGKMGEAILAGLLASRYIAPEAIVAVEPSAERRVVLESAYEVATASSVHDCAFGPDDVVLVAVKPQVIDGVLTDVNRLCSESLVISIAVGINTSHLEQVLYSGAPVVRVMPNTPALVGEGMALVSGGSRTNQNQIQLVLDLFGSIGRAVIIPEYLQNAGAAISGSGPAYFALFIDGLARAGVAAGLSRDVAQMLACQTMLGTAEMLLETGQHPEELIDGVSSPGGTTIQAIATLERYGVRAALNDAVESAIQRAEELSGN